MSVTLSSIETLVRYLIEDEEKTLLPGDIFTYSTSLVFTLTESNPVTINAVFKNDVRTGNYTYDADAKKVTLTRTPDSGDTIEIRYTFFPNYSSSEIQNYIRAALMHLSINNYKTFIIENTAGSNPVATIFPEPEEREKNLIAVVAATLIEPNNRTLRLPDVSIVVPRDLPTNQKISRIISIFKNDTSGIFKVL